MRNSASVASTCTPCFKKLHVQHPSRRPGVKPSIGVITPLFESRGQQPAHHDTRKPEYGGDHR
jgi:hypothetical protein